MSEKTAYWFSRYKIPFVSLPGHTPAIAVKSTRSGQTVKVWCEECGWSSRFTGCNEAGVCYAIHDGVKGFHEHASNPGR